MSNADDAHDSVPEILDSHLASHAAPGAGGYDVLPAFDETAPTRSHRGRWVALVAGVAAVALVAAGGVAVGLSLSGGGTQPEDLVPANAIVYLDLDLDPSAAQKVNALRFLRHFPSASKALGPSGDIRGLLGQAFDGLPISRGGDLPSWLGQRFGLAVLPGAGTGGAAGTPIPEVVLQVTDEDAARAGLNWAFQTGASVAVSDGYAVITQDPQSAQSLIDQAHNASLGSSASFTDAMAPLGDGVASFYVDTAAVAQLEQQLGPLLGLGTSQPADPGPGGIAAGVVRFQPDAIELVASAPSSATSDAAASLVATLPETTVAAVGASSSADLIKAQTATVLQRLSALTALGVRSPLAAEPGARRLPQDVMSLIGDQMAISVDRRNVTTDPMVGFLSHTDPQQGARAIDDLVAMFGRHGTQVASASTSDTVVLANDADYAATLAAQDGTLGDNPAFQSAVPEADGASLIAFVDLSALLSADGAVDPDVAAWGAVGVSAHEADGRTTYLVRVTVTG